MTLSSKRWNADCAAAGGVAALPGGGVVASGFAGGGGEGGDGIRAAVARLRADGRLDRWFARAGVWQTWSLRGADALAVQASGRIRIAGATGYPDYCEGGQMRLVGSRRAGASIARSAEWAHGHQGRRPSDSGVHDLSLTPSGRILAAGWAEGAGRSGSPSRASTPPDASTPRAACCADRHSAGAPAARPASRPALPVKSYCRASAHSDANRSQFILARYSGGRGTRQVIPFGGYNAAAWDLASVAGRTVAVGESARGEDSDFAIAILP